MKRMECLNTLFRLGTLVVVLLTGNGVQADEITGYVYDAKSGETVIGAYVWEEPRGRGIM